MDEWRNIMGKLETIWVKRAKRGVMDQVETATLVEGRGVQGSADQGGKRQVTILSKEVWEDLMAQFNSDLDPATRRANLLVSGIDLEETRGKTLCVGDCQIRIYFETAPCERMDEAIMGLQAVMRSNWKGGAFGEVVKEGEIQVGDVVTWLE